MFPIIFTSAEVKLSLPPPFLPIFFLLIYRNSSILLPTHPHQSFSYDYSLERVQVQDVQNGCCIYGPNLDALAKLKTHNIPQA
jgi:hypothetical protein